MRSEQNRWTCDRCERTVTTPARRATRTTTPTGSPATTTSAGSSPDLDLADVRRNGERPVREKDDSDYRGIGHLEKPHVLGGEAGS